MKELYFLVAAAVVGLLVGAAASTFQQEPSETYCERLEADLQANQSIQGALACYSPASSFANVSEDVEESTELQCICEQQLNGTGRTFTIRRSR